MYKIPLKLRSLRFRIIIFFICIDVILSAVLAVAGVISTNRLNGLYDTRVAEQKSTFQNTVDEKGSLTRAMVSDYSVWDDTYAYLDGKMPDYPKLNISSDSLGTFESDILWLYKKDFTLATSLSVFDQTLDLSAYKSQIKQMLGGRQTVHFYENTTKGVLDIYGATVVRSNDYDHVDSSTGYLFIGRLLSQKSLDDLKSTNIEKITLVSPQEIKSYPLRLPAREGKTVFTIPLNDINKKIVAYIYVRYDSKTLKELDLLGTRLLWLNGLTFLVLIVSSYLAVWRAVIRPLNLVYGALETDDTANLKRIPGEQTEFGRIARLIERFFMQEKQAEVELQEKRDLLDKLTKTSVEIEQTNKVMVGRELKMIDMKRRIAELEQQLGERPHDKK